MCRITGFWDFHENLKYDANDVIIKMRDSMVLGGPDGAGLYLYNQSGTLALGHRRLSIIDLSDNANQPMTYKHYKIVYNGEVYNYNEIKNELIQKGHKFITSSDTEVILHAWDEWKILALEKFHGMWAFAIFDENEKKLILCRDRIGVKPLYWYFKDGLFIFSSTLKAFHFHPKFKKQLDYEALTLYLQYGYITAPKSIFCNTYKLEPGHILEISSNSIIKKIKYWDIDDLIEKSHFKKNIIKKYDENEVLEQLNTVLTNSFKLRMVSDVPVGMYLSGGVDSSLLTAILTKEYGNNQIKTFTIGFNEKKYDESVWAKNIANYLGTEHIEQICTAKDALDIILKLPEIYDEPLGDPSIIPTYLVSQLAKTKVKVVLSADGGDELFCGYNRYEMLNKIKIINSSLNLIGIKYLLSLFNNEIVFNIYNKVQNVFLKESITNFKDKFKKLNKIINTIDFINKYDISNKYFLDDDIYEMGFNKLTNNIYNFKDVPKGLNCLEQMMYYDLKTYLPDDILVKVDRAGMSVSLENREPFLDHKIIEFALNLPIDFKFKNKTLKYILKQLLYKYIPKELVNRPKQGFGAPIYEWFKNDLKNYYNEYLSYDKIKSENIFNPKIVQKIVDDYLNDYGINPYKPWFLFIFELWYEKYMKQR